MDWISSESLPGLPRESEAFMVLFCLFVCLFVFSRFRLRRFFFWKTEGKKNTSTCVQCTKKMVEGFVRSRSQEHNWYYTCNLALQSVHTSLVRSWCFSCPPSPSLSLFLLSTLLSFQVGTYEDFIVVQFYRGQSYQVFSVIYLMIGFYGRELS